MRFYQEDVEKALLRAGEGPLDLSRATGIDLNALGLVLVHLEAGGRWTPPASREVGSWLNRIGFDAATGGEPPRGPDSDVLLELTRVARDEDVGTIIERVLGQTAALLKRFLRYEPADVRRFCVALSEMCQNIPEHAGAPGWAAMHRYAHEGRNIVKIAVVDTGRGVRSSLGERLKLREDMEALEAALLRNISRHDDTGRGNGLREVRKLAERWGAKVTLRSGTAKLSVVSEGMRGPGRVKGLRRLPGTQVLMTFPELPAGERGSQR